MAQKNGTKFVKMYVKSVIPLGIKSAQSAGAVEYTNYISAEG